MHKEILSKAQIEILPLISVYKKEFYLVGGTAIALHIGHRRSIDFDLFKEGKLNHKKIIDKIKAFGKNYVITRRVTEQLNVSIDKVKLTFFEYPFDISVNYSLNNIIKLPDLLTLAAMKAFALGKRSKWKDYVDLYYILKDYYSISIISEKATEIFGDLFSEKLFRAQLSYFEDVDYTEKVEFMKGFDVSQETIKKNLINLAIKI